MPAPRKVVRRSDIEDKNIKTKAAFEQFIYEKAANGLVEETLSSYRITFNKFLAFFEESVENTYDIGSELITEWKVCMSSVEELRTTTINHHISNIRAFLYWCMEDDRNYVRPFRITLTKVKEEMPKDYTVEEVKALLKKPERKAPFTEWRMWAVCCFVIGTGARLGTLVDIRFRDIDLNNGKVFYQHTKNKKLQFANLSPQLVKSLNDYISEWLYNAKEDDYLFCKQDMGQISKAALSQAYGHYAHSRGVKKSNIHGLRHTFAREWFLNGGDVVQLSKILGHSTLAMSEHYMNVYADMAKDRFVEYNPLDNITRNAGTKRIVRNKNKANGGTA